MPSPYDVIVIGAGPAGSTAAYFLAKGGLRVALLDKFDFPRDKTCGDGLTPRALKVLKGLEAVILTLRSVRLVTGTSIRAQIKPAIPAELTDAVRLLIVMLRQTGTLVTSTFCVEATNAVTGSGVP